MLFILSFNNLQILNESLNSSTDIGFMSLKCSFTIFFLSGGVVEDAVMDPLIRGSKGGGGKIARLS